MTKGQMEVQLRESFVKLFQKEVGKGPANIIVKIVRNYIVIELEGILTPLEKNLLNMEDGEKEVQNLQKKIFANSIKDYISLVEKIIKSKVIDIVTKVNIKHNKRYILAIAEIGYVSVFLVFS